MTTLTYHTTIKQTIDRAVANKTKLVLAIAMFDDFFSVFPEAKRHFQGTDIQSFGPQKFNYISDFFLDTIQHPQFAEVHISEEVYRHTAYSVNDKEYYFGLLDAFQQVVLQGAEEKKPEVIEIWNDVAMGMKSYIQMGADAYLQ